MMRLEMKMRAKIKSEVKFLGFGNIHGHVPNQKSRNAEKRREMSRNVEKCWVLTISKQKSRNAEKSREMSRNVEFWKFLKKIKILKSFLSLLKVHISFIKLIKNEYHSICWRTRRVEKCRETSRNAEKCREMSRNVEFCRVRCWGGDLNFLRYSIFLVSDFSSNFLSKLSHASFADLQFRT